MAEYALGNPRASLETFLDRLDTEKPKDVLPMSRQECEAALQVREMLKPR